MNKSDFWVLEWSHANNNVHVQPVDWMTARNHACLRNNTRPSQGYVPIFVGSREAVEAEADRVRSLLIERENGK